MRIREDQDRISWADYLRGVSGDGSGKGSRCSRLANSEVQEGSPTIPGICQFLPEVHPRLLPPCQTSIQPHRERNMEVGKRATGSIRGTPNQGGIESSPIPTQR